MLTKAIVLKNIKYSESSLISTMYTELYGIQTYMINGVRKTNKQGGTKANILQTGQLLELETSHQANKNLQYIKNFNAILFCNQTANSIIKNAILVFCCELYYATLKNPEPNEELFELLTQTILHIEHTPEKLLANFPIYFSLRLSFLLGYSFQGEPSETHKYIDLQEGYYTASKNTNTVNEYNTALLHKITNTPLEHIAIIEMNKAVRFSILNDSILFLKLHVPEMREINSLKVLHEIF